MSKRVLAGLAVLGVMVIAGLVAGWGASPGETAALSAADVVALRFPPDWNDDDTAATPPPATYGLASATEPQFESRLLFSPYQTFPAAQPPAGVAAAPPVAIADPAPDAASEIKTQLKSEPKPSPRVAAAAPERRPAPRRKDSGALFNDAQLVSIKNRLRLSALQEEYWPPVESALRDIAWKAAHDDARKTGSRAAQAAGIDPNSTEVQRLKSAAIPLIMSMNEDQKREVRMLAQVMGLQQVAASF